MSSISDCIIKILADNGVSVEEKEIWGFSGKFENVIQLDFSEHDKAFVDKIAELEKEVAGWKAEARENKKNRDEQLKSVRKAVRPYVDIGHMHETIMELKQRISELEDKIGDRDEINRCLREQIAELESKESVKPMRIEFHADNGEMLTPLGVANLLVNQNTFKVDELRELAEHLQAYCRHHNDREPETISF